MGMDGFDSFIFGVFPIFFFIIFAFVIGTFIFAAVRGFKEHSYNNSQPVLSVDAKVVIKRADVSTHRHSNMNSTNNHHHHTTYSSSTTYYVTFEVESGDRMELQVSGSDYGLLAEGDTGKLTFQGRRYLGFQRKIY